MFARSKIYVNNCKTDALLLRILVLFSIFDPRNPAEPYFWPPSLIGTNTLTFYLAHENPYQHSCWGKNGIFRILKFYFSRFFPNSCADRGSHGLNSMQACYCPLGCRSEKGFREGSACQKSILAAGFSLKVHHFYNFSYKT